MIEDRIREALRQWCQQIGHHWEPNVLLLGDHAAMVFERELANKAWFDMKDAPARAVWEWTYRGMRVRLIHGSEDADHVSVALEVTDKEDDDASSA